MIKYCTILHFKGTMPTSISQNRLNFEQMEKLKLKIQESHCPQLLRYLIYLIVDCMKLMISSYFADTIHVVDPNNYLH